MRRDPSPSRDRASIHSPELRALTEAPSLEDAVEAALRWGTARGATEARIHLRVAPEADPRTWSLVPGGTVRSPAPPHPLVDALVDTAPEAGTRTVGERDPSRGAERVWTCLPLFPSSRATGSLALAFPASSPLPGGTDVLAALLSVKLEELEARRRLDADRARQSGWFQTMDEQIRILERERQKLSALVNMTDAGVVVTDTEGTVTWLNPVVSRRVGPAHGPLTCADLLCGSKEMPCADCPVAEVKEGRPVAHKERREERGGQVRHLYVSGFPVRAPNGEVSEILIMLQDISDLETLRRSEARYHRLFERSADAMVMADPRTLEVIMANAQARRRLGLDPGAVPRPSLLLLHPPGLRKEMRQRYARIGRGRTLENVDVEVTAADGETLTCNACGTLFDLDGSEVMLLEYRDVTHLRRLQDELTRAEHLIALGTMSAGIAHEFKNRLAPLRAFAQIISKQSPGLERVERHAPILIREIDRLAALVRDILDYARPQDPVLERLDLRDVVKDCADRFCVEFKEVAPAGGFECELVLGDDPIPIRADDAQIDRALFNVFKNGLDAVQERESPRLRCTVSREGEEGVVRVEDNGCGIDEETLRLVFNPFFTTKGSRGTGLGMCITRSLLEGNRARIELRSRQGEGTTVELRFPLAARERKAA